MAGTPLDLLRDEAQGCMKCRLAAGRTQVVVGSGDPGAELMVVGEAPGASEDLEGRPFVGRSGQLLDRLLHEELGMTRDEVYVTNVVKCRPESNRDPRPDEVDACNPYLVEQLRLVAPSALLTLGNFASRTVLRTKVGITKLRGQVHTLPEGGGGPVVVPTFHPAAALRGGPKVADAMREDLRLVAAVLTGGTPSVGPVRAGGPIR